jgi:hypothetical protein
MFHGFEQGTNSTEKETGSVNGNQLSNGT